MIRRTIAAVAVVAMAVAASPLQAQSKKELVNRLLLLQQPGVEQLARQIAEEPALQLSLGARQALAGVPQDKREAVAKSLEAEVKKYLDESIPLVRDRAIRLMPSTIGQELETNFNEAELKQLIDWFESPVIKRFQTLGPQIQRNLGEKLVGETRGQVEPKLKTLQTAMARHLGLPPPDGAAAPSGGAPMPGNRGGDPGRK
jgi:hypothetical protein